MIAGRGTTRAEDAQGTPTQSHVSPSILVYEENLLDDPREEGPAGGLGARVVDEPG